MSVDQDGDDLAEVQEVDGHHIRREQPAGQLDGLRAGSYKKHYGGDGGMENQEKLFEDLNETLFSKVNRYESGIKIPYIDQMKLFQP